jgi:hypothetical protein
VAGIVAVAAASVSTAVAQAAPVAPSVPAAIQVPDGNKVFLVGHAVGVQIYQCNATPGGFTWDLEGPRANLYADNGKLIATTSAGRPGRPATAARSSASAWTASPSTPVRSRGCCCRPTPRPPAATARGSSRPPSFSDRHHRRSGSAGRGVQNEVPYTAGHAFWKATGG